MVMFDFASIDVAMADSMESKNKSKRDHFSHVAGIGPSLFPNSHGYYLESPITYNDIDSIYKLKTEYFFTEPDSSVRVIMYEWDWPSKLVSFEKDSDYHSKGALRNSKIYQFKYEQLKSELTSLLGPPDIEEINSTDTTNHYRDGSKWIKSNVVSCYLYVIGNKDSIYGQVRLVVYEGTKPNN